jgi:hypothetical protein
MAKTNLLVKVTITFPPDEIVPILRFMRCPILPSNQIVLQNLKTFVMSHEIIKRVDDQDLFMTPWTFVLLHRDLDRFCEGLADHLYVIKQHDELVSHIITILPSNQIVLQNLKTFVMSHEIIKRVDDQDLLMTPWTFVLLHRDLDRFCEGLADHLYVIKQHDELVSHIITLVDHSQNGPHTLEPYSQKFLEMLLAPYRDKLRGFPRFTIRGAITDDLAAATMAQVTGPRAEDPELVLSELEELKAKGNDSYGQGDVRMANEHWSRALMKINRLMNGSSGERLREAGGLDFVNRMIALHFDLCSNRAQATIDEMRFFYSDLQSDPELVRSLTERFFNSVVGARDPGNLFILFPGFTWEPSHRKLAKLAYREAVGCRLIGERQFVLQAESAIETAITLLPNDPQLKREKERFSQWKSHVYG